MKFILNIFSEWGLLAVFVLILLEYACFPIPSEIVLPFAGFIVGSNGYNLVGVILLSIIMGYLGCLLCYLIGYYGGKYIYDKLYNKFVKWRKGLDKASNMFDKYGGISVLLCRLLPLCRTYISFFAGIFKQGLFKYSFYSLIGISIWNTILISFGYTLMDKWDVVSFYYDKYKTFLLFILIVLLIIFFCFKMYKKKKINKK